MVRRFIYRLGTEGWALLALRLVVGFGFAAHGYAKLERGPEQFATILATMGVPAPLVMAWVTVVVELLGGASLLLGVAVRQASLPLVLVMIVALAKIHFRYGFSSIRLKSLTGAGAQFGPVGYELNLLYICSLLVLALAPATPLSLERWLLRGRKRASRA